MNEVCPIHDDIWAAIPVYNNGETVRAIAAAARQHLKHVLVVDDGSMDGAMAARLKGLDVTLLTHPVNLGKGRALLTALNYIANHNGRTMIALDGDGQHDPADIPKLAAVAQKHPNHIVIGRRDFSAPEVPPASRMGRRWANFWLQVLTGQDPGDAQSGFRAYPVAPLRNVRFSGRRYEFETEVLAKGAWGGLSFSPVDIAVSYAPQQRRLSNFRPFVDNLRITHAHVLLVLRRLLPWPHRRLIPRSGGLRPLLLHPHRFMMNLLKEHASPQELALSAAVAIFLATFPLIGLHMIVIFYVTSRLNLNRVMALSAQNLCMPPVVPFLCIQIGHRWRAGSWLTEASRQTIVHQAHYRLLEWLLGSLILAPILAILAWLVVFKVAAHLQGKGQHTIP